MRFKSIAAALLALTFAGVTFADTAEAGRKGHRGGGANFSFSLSFGSPYYRTYPRYYAPQYYPTYYAPRYYYPKPRVRVIYKSGGHRHGYCKYRCR